MTVSNGIHLLHQDSHSCAIDGYDELVFILRIRIVLTLRDMDSEGCLYPSSRDNFSTDLGCVLCISSSANFLHVHSTKHIWCMTPVSLWTVSSIMSDIKIHPALFSPCQVAKFDGRLHMVGQQAFH